MENAKLNIIADIAVIPELNSRKKYDPADLRKLGADIKINGLLHPVTVWRDTKDELKKGKPFVLVAGFRRLAAVQSIGAESIDARILPATVTLKEALMANLSENLSRESISTFEIAHHCLMMKRDHRMDAKAISEHVRGNTPESRGDKKAALSESHVRNLTRFAADLSPAIQAAWADGHQKATFHNFAAILAKCKTDHEDQDGMWDIITGAAKPEPEGDDDGDGEKGEKGGKGGKPAATAKRPTADKLMMAIACIEESKHAAAWKEGARVALEYAAGKRKTIPGVSLTAPKASGGSN